MSLTKKAAVLLAKQAPCPLERRHAAQAQKRAAGRRKRYFTWMGVLFLAAAAAGTSAAYGRQGSTGSDSPLSGWQQPGQDQETYFSLSPYRSAGDSAAGGGSASLSLSPQQQPFVETAAVRLRDDDPEYIKKISPFAVALKILTSNTFTWAVDRFVFNYSWSHIGPKTWEHNLKTGWVWDTDRFGMNFFFHPYSGGAYFNSARSNGYGYFTSLPFVFLGSLMWEYFGENTLPAYNDIINTTLSGALFGEILYRLSSQILDDRTTGSERFFRELAAAIISPGRALGRLLQKKLNRVTTKEIYQKEPLNITLAAGAHWFNTGTTVAHFGKGGASASFAIHIDYGDPFEIRPRKPFDFFKMRLNLSYGKNIGKKYLDNLIGYGLLFGETVHTGNLEMLIGAFQHYDYWDSHIFEVGALGFGGGIIGKWQFTRNWNMQTAFHLELLPLGATNSPYIDIVEGGIPGRNYDYSGGASSKFESTLNFAKIGQVTVIYYLYWLRTYVGPVGEKTIAIFKPRIAVRLYKNLSLGFEYTHYRKYNNLRDLPDVHRKESEQKLYLMLYF